MSEEYGFRDHQEQNSKTTRPQNGQSSDLILVHLGLLDFDSYRKGNIKFRERVFSILGRQCEENSVLFGFDRRS